MESESRDSITSPDPIQVQPNAHLCSVIIIIIYLLQTISHTQSSNTSAQKWLVIAQCRVGVSAQSTLSGAKHSLHPNYNVSHSSAYRDLAGGEK